MWWHTETRFRPSPKRTNPFKSAGVSVQSTAGSRGVRISVSNAGYTTFRDSVRVLATHSIRQSLLHFPSRASPCAITFKTHSTFYKFCFEVLPASDTFILLLLSSSGTSIMRMFRKLKKTLEIYVGLVKTKRKVYKYNREQQTVWTWCEFDRASLLTHSLPAI